MTIKVSPLLIMTTAERNVSSADAELTALVAVVMGSDSDLSTMQPAVEILTKFGIKVSVRILSAHRTPKEMMKFAEEADEKGLKVIIAGAGGAAHLPGMIASITSLPVIGVPVKSSSLSGVDSMLSILQMPRGIPVATVSIEGGLNAGLIAAQILGVSNNSIKEKVKEYRQDLYKKIISKDNSLSEIGIKKYLERM